MPLTRKAILFLAFVWSNDSGGYFANTYPNLVTGMARGRTVTFGRHVDRHSAKLKV